MVHYHYIYIHSVSTRYNPNHDIVGYDCSHQDLNFTTINLNTVGKCLDLVSETFTQTEEIQLVEIVEETMVTVYHCHVLITRTIFHCGMHSHSSIVSGGFMSYPYKILEKRFKSAVDTGELCIFCNTRDQVNFSNLKSGQCQETSYICRISRC